MNKKLLYKKAYRYLENSTPLKFDCGSLCDKKCCSGSDLDGMMMFPDEDIVFEGNNSFLNIRKEKLAEIEIAFSVCDGICDREFRPLWCRVFPFAPYIDPDGRLSVIEDPRVKYICPILGDDYKVDSLFIRNILKTFRILIEDNEIYEYLFLISRILDDYSRFVGGIIEV